jgi:hypothetical protein
MARTLKIIAVALIVTLATLILVRLRSSRANRSELGSETPLRGSFDTWPEVPRKQAA